ncbi:multifunctional 2',3'-cyclic-nucleotide 2'-phosphodiesterase/3'-nucleotidase/5'-nucleotidase [Clostridium septicum]|uniref:Multifunctional 2',3'-cyclic-nucleotide 2'-phosphodiesterase/3'-nucleotidase/5'-nucleotidase n=2 Tax=Clostridium septicum TaxID=1504 RepID=A0ABY5B769_CLOSE|nr:multifunctional 2',3'-cyclic-nucleotide 2'-phosphodiesterase/3'-nucleotidase/5'-nucleotidase [Clostridium septicum]UEC22320.1 multifunctional 2',3'-cyclic-nucleotide 2'-phosphodiesterase/3'-nucleotidase/5'-nucleotidase [Clostridium septicum]USS02447.1 multifunctional 2',3'-cyclic-nucleotide 2'-phosphodiesterase/3'-nucleotidase/5'-nucleotidase [Clostridium septicum]
MMENTNNKKRILSFLLTLTMMVSFILPSVDVNAITEELGKNNEEITIKILGTSDMHGRFMNYEYSRNLKVDGGLNQIATIVKNEKAQNPNTIVIDNGDTIQGNYNHLFVNGENPMIAGMNAIGYDVFSLGNHEFNYGMENLNNVVAQANENLAILSANFYKGNERVFNPYVIKELSGVRVAIIGIVTPHIMKWDSQHLVGYNATNPAEEVAKVINEIKENGGADVFVVSAHMGIDGEFEDGDGDSLIEVANRNPEVSAILGGHSHQAVASETIGNTIVSLPKSNGEFVSKIELTVRKNNNNVEVINKQASLVGTKGVQEDESLNNELNKFHEIALADANKKIGEMVGGDLATPNEVKGITQAIIEDGGVTDLVNEVQLYNSKKQLEKIGVDTNNIYQVSAAALFSSNSNIKEGPITKAGISNIYKYDNKLYTIKTTGKQLKKYLEKNAEFFNKYNDGDLTISFNSDIPLFLYDMFDGIDYTMDISKEVGDRITEVKFEKDGKEVEDTDEVYLTVNDYRYNSGLIPLLDEGTHEKVYDSNNDTISDVRDLIINYIENEKSGILEKSVDNNWRIVGNNWDEKQRELAVKTVNEGKIKVPNSNSKSLTWTEVKEALSTNIQLLSFNDFHGNVLESGKNIGASKLVAEIKRLKNENPNTFVLSAGDSFQGTAISNLLHGEPVAKMMKEMGVTYSAVGNHEFDWDRSNIEEWAKIGQFEFLASNIYDKETGKPVEWAKPYGKVETNGKVIGLIGLATPETAYKTKPDNVKDLEFKDITESTKKWVEYLRNEEKVDAVVVLGHIGSEQNSTTGEIKGEAADLAKEVKGIDAIISSHTHKFVNGKVNDVAIIQAGYNGRALGKLNFNFDYENKLTVEHEVDELYKRVSDLTEDEDMKAIIDKYNENLAPILNEVVVNVDTDLTHDRYEGLSKLGQFITKYMAEVSGTQIAITNGGGLRKPLPAGDITVGDMWEVMPFDNTLVTMKLKGSDLKRVIEHGIMNESIGWVQYYGLRVYYDKDAEAGNRITSMKLLDGTKVDMNKYYTVVTNDFMATNGDNYDFSGAIDVVDTAEPIRDAIINVLKPLGKVSFKFDSETLVAGKDTEIEKPGNPSNPSKPGDTDNTNKPEGNTNGKLPETGSPIAPNFVIFLGSLSLIGGIVIRKKKNIS